MQIRSSPPLIVIGHDLRGATTSLFALLLLDRIGLGKKRPLCITFDSPLIGDKKLQETISRTPAENLTHSNSLYASISLKLEALGLTLHMQQQQQQNVDIKTLAKTTETLERTIILQNRKTFDPTKKLNDVKINMAQLEWYKKDSNNRDIGYYVTYKNMNLLQDHDVVLYHKTHPTLEKMGVRKHYETEKRSKHFVQLEGWFKEDAAKSRSNSNS
ncbi:hypothetical protein VNO80_13954 [Phaseolus coccineus]|uniref:Uncharacterized protein n=1 Tax=Phaseolus coccineus TaxID=3886 RepID=A0AAN9N1U4_PHACN